MNSRLDSTKAKRNKKVDAPHKRTGIVFTKDNINSHLIAYTESPNKYDIVGMLAYLFKTFKDQPAELLSKVKILTRNKLAHNKQAYVDDPSIHKSVVLHIFQHFNLKNGFFPSFFEFMKADGPLPIHLCNFYFGSQIDSEDVPNHLNLLFDKLKMIYEEHSPIKLQLFIDRCMLAMECPDLSAFDFEFTESTNAEAESTNVEHKISKDFTDKLNQSTDTNQHANMNASNESDSLVSLNDDCQIALIDSNLSKMFNKHSIPVADVELSSKITNCINNLIINNYIMDINQLWYILYFLQFYQINYYMKQACKSFIKKFGDKPELFKMFRVGSMLLPELYSLFDIFNSECGDCFSCDDLVRDAHARGTTNILLNKARNQLNKKYGLSSEETSKLNKKLKIERKENEKKEIKRNEEESSKRSEEGGNDEETSEVNKKISEERNEEQNIKKKKSFAQKVGKKLAAKKRENKKKYRYEEKDGKETKKSVIRKREYFKKKFSRH